MHQQSLTRRENETIAEAVMGWKPDQARFLWHTRISSEFLPRFDACVHDARRLERRLTELFGWGIMYGAIEGKPHVHCIHRDDLHATQPLFATGATHMEALCRAALILAERMKSC